MTRTHLETLRELLHALVAVEPDLHPRATQYHAEAVTTIRHALGEAGLPALQLALDAELRATAVRS